MKVVYTSVWLGHSGDITAASNYGSVSDDPLAKQYLGSYFFGTLATTGPGAADFVDLGEQYQYGFGGPINKPASEGSTGFTVGANTLIFAMEPTGFASGPPPDGFAPILTPASYDVSGSATIGGLSVDSGGIVTLTGAITSNGTQPGNLYIPNPKTGAFDGFGQFRQPWQFNLGLQLSYDVTPTLKANFILTNLVNQCFGGSSTPWSKMYPPSSVFCGYTSNTFYNGGNFYNGNSPYDVAANGVRENPYFSQPFVPSYGDPNSGNYPMPINLFVSLSLRV